MSWLKISNELAEDLHKSKNELAEIWITFPHPKVLHLIQSLFPSFKRKVSYLIQNFLPSPEGLFRSEATFRWGTKKNEVDFLCSKSNLLLIFFMTRQQQTNTFEMTFIYLTKIQSNKEKAYLRGPRG